MIDLLVESVFAGILLVALVTLPVSAPTAPARLGATARSTDLHLWASVGVCPVLLVLAIRSERRQPARYLLGRLWPAAAARPVEHERPMEVQR